MSEEDCPKYKDGDVVWVKLGSCWWPGEVTENGPEDFSSKKPPLAIVKFFNESTYEFVKSYNNIYFYNCERKNEFIKKGMDSFRANNSHMEKFPGDVSLAEIRTDGNPNILSDPMFAPQKKSNIIAEVFGSPSPKKAHKDGARHSRGRSSTSKNSAKKQTKVNITHRRFLGCDDYEAHIRVQYPGKDAGHLSSDEEITRLNAEPSQTFDCSSCSFNTTRLEVMLFHVQCHIKGIASPVQVKKKSSPKKKRSRIVKHITSDDDRTNSSAGYVDTDSEEEAKPKQKRKRRSQGGSAKRTKQKKTTVEEEKTAVTDIRTNLLAEWSDSEENDDGESSKLDTSGENVEETTGEKDKDKEELSNNQQKDLSKSCFDFEEEEEEDNSIIHTAVGRKIPRVIPEKRKSTDPDNEDASLPLAEDDENRMEILKVNENLNENSTEKDTELVKETESQFKDLMESTSVPELPEVPDTIKPSQQNSADGGKSVKIPDKKNDNNVTEVATKLTNPKKRFVKSFEDFELLLNEQRRAQEEREEELRRDKKKEKVTVEPVEVVEPKIVEDVDTKVPQTEDSSSMELEEPNEEVIQEKTAEKLTESTTKTEDTEETPVEKEETKSTEPAVEEEQEATVEQKRVETPVSTVEETIEEEKSEEKPEETGKEAMEEESSGESSKKSDSNLQISKLKCQIMSKLSDEDAEPSKSSKSKSSQHKTPRSKILDKYNEQKSKRSSRSSEEKEEPTHEESVVNSSSRKGHAPKKSKYLKFNQEEAGGSGGESVEKIEEEPVAKEETTSKEMIKEDEAEKSNPDEEMRKINQIDEYFKDFLFTFDNKKPEHSPKETVTEEMKIAEDGSSSKEEEEEEKTVTNEVRIKCAGSDEESEGDLDIAIKTNLTNFNKNDEEMSALSTLAMVSQLENNFEKAAQEDDEKMEVETPVPAPVPEISPEPVKPNFEEHFVKKPDSELITIDGNLTVVSEKDLADGQVEITANASPSYKKPVTLTNFSMDFSECNSNSDSVSSEQSDTKIQEEIKTTESNKEATKKSQSDDMYDLEEHIPSQIVDKTKPAPPPPTSKLLERLTTTTTAAVAASEVKIPAVSKTAAPKVPTATTPSVATKPTKTKFVIKQPQSSSGASNSSKFGSPAQTTSSKPIILSEKIIKPAKVPSESAGSVSVQKITSKRNLHDPDEIDTYIIQKEGKSVEEEEELELSLGEDLPEVPTKKLKRATTTALVKKLQHQSPQTQTTIKKRGGGKAKILQQTIITPAGEIIQPTVGQTTAAVTDDNVFDINSMPIVLSDQILTPESIENMPIFLSDTVQTTGEVVAATAPITTTTKLIQQQQPATMVKKSPAAQGQMRLLNKSLATPPSLISASTTMEKKLVKTPKILGSVGSKIIKQNSFAAGSSSKHGKYVIVTSSSTVPQAKYAVSKKQPTLIKRTSSGDLTGTLTKMTPEPSGNKIMILTNQQGQQQRVLLTPAQQKMMGYQTSQGGKVTKTVVKGNIIQKGKDGQMTAVAGSSGLISKSIGSSRMNSNQTLISSSGHVLTPIHPHQQQKTVRIEKSSPMSTGRKLQMQSQKVSLKPQQKTILIKNQHGQTVRKIQGTDDALLDQQVAEQLEAIKASGMLQQKQEILNYKAAATPPKTMRRSYAKKIDGPKQQMMTKMAANTNLVKTEAAMPPLAPISPKKPEQQIHVTPTEKVAVANQQQETKAQQQQQQERPLNQLVIQDAMGNQTTITEGQILALPSETVDGQPQSYMLVTLDESGNLTPLNNEALLSLDPNLGLGGDLGNTVLQIDQSALKEETTQQEAVVQQQPEPKQPEEAKETVVGGGGGGEEVTVAAAAEKAQEQLSVEAAAAALQTVNCSVGTAETGQQLIVTGDPIAAQKFLESLTEGNTDLANILASAEGSSILIQADGQQILINTDSDNQMLLSVNTDNLNMAESSEGGGNPIFATQPPSKNQDILAAALADTDVFQQEQQNGGGGAGQSGGSGGNAGSKVGQSQLSPNSALYPINVGNVLETSLTLNSPIMTPLEVPSTNSKKIISDESDILNQVPKNVDLPITITDPNISQTVSQQQVASMMVNELQSNLELSLPISESITVASSEMNSPSFVYSLPNLDGSVDIGQKAFNSSMPLLTEDGEESTETPSKKEEEEEEEREEEAAAAAKATTPPPTEETTSTAIDEKRTQQQTMEDDAKSEDSKIASEGSFLDESEGLCTLGSEMCSSLSEPPPDMFDLSAVLSSHHQMKASGASPSEEKQAEEGKSVGGGDNMEIEEAELKIDDKVGEESVSSESANQESASTSSPATMMNEDSCEIPVQPEIVTTLKESDGFEDEPAATTTTSNDKDEEVVEETTEESKSCKFD